MIIDSLNISFEGSAIITDIDDCLIETTSEIKKNGLKPKSFWFDEQIYEKYKHQIFMNAKLTPWGEEFLQIVRAGQLKFEMLTAARNRLKILIKKFDVPEESILENYLKYER